MTIRLLVIEKKGRCDILLQAKKANMTSYILEFKYSKNIPLDKLARDAIQQIINNKYDHELNELVVYLGLAHNSK